MKFRVEVIPFLLASIATGLILFLIVRGVGAPSTVATTIAGAFILIACLYFLYFFRDPERLNPRIPNTVISAAEGHIASIADIPSDAFREHARRSGVDPDILGRLAHADATRISVFLSPLNVHVNRAPIAGMARFLGYFPGKHIFTFDEKSSEENQHNAILFESDQTACLLNQIVGPVCRRVVYWPDHNRPVPLQQGDRIGMMKFGSRLDLYFPRNDIRVVVKPGDFVRAGETVIAHLTQEKAP